MLDHQVFDQQADLQRTRFAGGAEALVNFGETPAPDPADPNVLLAPRGYRVRAAGLRQERLWVDGVAVTELESDDLVVVDSPVERTACGVTHVGRVTAFANGDGAWTVFGEPTAAATVDVGAVTGWQPERRYQLRPLARGARGEPIRVATADEPLALPASDAGWAFVLEPVDPGPDVRTADAAGDVQ